MAGQVTCHVLSFEHGDYQEHSLKASGEQGVNTMNIFSSSGWSGVQRTTEILKHGLCKCFPFLNDLLSLLANYNWSLSKFPPTWGCPKSFTFLLYFLNVFHVFKNTGSVLVSKYGFNKLPQNQWFNTRQIYNFTVLEVRRSEMNFAVLKSTC